MAKTPIELLMQAKWEVLPPMACIKRLMNPDPEEKVEVVYLYSCVEGQNG